MRFRAALVAGLAGTLAAVCSRAGCATIPSADEIVKKCLASYDAAKTFQSDVKFLKRSGKSAFQISMHVQAEIGADGMIARSAMDISGTGDPKLIPDFKSQQVIDDGTNVFVVHPDRKQYATGPHAPDRVSGVFRRSLINAQAIAGRLSVKVDQVHCPPTYVLSSKLADGKIEIRIDKASFHLRNIHMARGKPPASEVSDVSVASQVFDQPISGETFVWKAPPGFTLAPDDVGEPPAAGDHPHS